MVEAKPQHLAYQHDEGAVRSRARKSLLRVVDTASFLTERRKHDCLAVSHDEATHLLVFRREVEPVHLRLPNRRLGDLLADEVADLLRL